MLKLMSVDNLTKNQLHRIFHVADKVDDFGPVTGILCSMFFEPSTRTRLSFESAMIQSGGNVLSVENAFDNSSNKKGESTKDMIRTISRFADYLVIRHPKFKFDFPEIEDEYFPCHIINAGDGSNEHPTQALIDLYTIQKHKIFEISDRPTILFCGDLLYSRTIHSLIRILRYTDRSFDLLLLPEADLKLPTYWLKDNNFTCTYVDNNSVMRLLERVDVVYMTRSQTERHDQTYSTTQFQMNSKILSYLKDTAIIMHPLPRNSEIDPIIDTDPRAVYFEQVSNGLQVRKALLRVAKEF